MVSSPPGNYYSFHLSGNERYSSSNCIYYYSETREPKRGMFNKSNKGENVNELHRLDNIIEQLIAIYTIKKNHI